jgi:hypothetical protein
MLRGDISNEIVPRLVLVFEGLIGLLIDPRAQAKYDKAMKRGKYKDAVYAFELNEIVAHHIWDLSYRRGFNLDVVTFLGHDFAEHLSTRLEEEGYPIGNVRATTLRQLTLDLPHRTDIAMVFDGNPAHALTYGGRGRAIDPYHPQFI